MKKIIKILIMIYSIFALFISSVSADIILVGTLGDDLFKSRYSIDEENVMTISKYEGMIGSVYTAEHPVDLTLRGYDVQNIKKIIFDNGILDIGKFSFSGLNSLAEVVLPNTLYSIQEWAFSDCNNLENIIFPEISSEANNVVNISSYAFSGCLSLNSVILPDCPINYYISNTAFYNTPIYNNPQCWENGMFYIDENAVFYDENVIDQIDNKEVIKIRIGTKTIMKNALTGNNDVVRIIVPDGVENIANAAFSNCVRLRQIYIPETVKYIGGNAFAASNNVTIFCSQGSFAHEYAVSNDIPCSFNVEEINSSLWKVGDVNKDLSISLRDALLVLKHVASIDILCEEVLQLADYNNDNAIDAKDAFMILVKIAYSK